MVGNLEYIDFDNDGENELVIHGYARSKLFLDVIGGTVYKVLETYTTTDMGNVAEMSGQRVIERTDLLHAGRKRYEIIKYDACGCLIDWFCLSVSYEGDNYSENDVFEYRNKEISLEEFEEIVNSIHSL